MKTGGNCLRQARG